MANKDAKEFSYNEKTGLYRKKVKNPNSGKWVPVYGHTKQEVRDKMREKSQLFSEAAAAEASSTSEAFCCVTLSISEIAWLT